MTEMETRHNQSLFAFFILLILAFFFVGACTSTQTGGEQVLVQNSYAGTCPNGMVDEQYPGSCGRYIDMNQDCLCDRSQPEQISVPV